MRMDEEAGSSVDVVLSSSLSSSQPPLKHHLCQVSLSTLAVSIRRIHIAQMRVQLTPHCRNVRDYEWGRFQMNVSSEEDQMFSKVACGVNCPVLLFIGIRLGIDGKSSLLQGHQRSMLQHLTTASPSKMDYCQLSHSSIP
jgi:hypothetical protein